MKRRVANFPMKNSQKLKYTDIIQLDTSMGVVDWHQFRANSLFDPDLTGTGHQPLSFDEWTSFYQRYKVHACKISINGIITSTTGGGIFILNARPELAVPVGVSVTEIERNNTISRVASQVGGENRVSLRMYRKTKFMYGKRTIIDEGYAGLDTTNPLFPWVYNIGLVGSFANAATADLVIKLTFYSEFFDKKTLLSS